MHPLYQNRQINRAIKLRRMARFSEAESILLEMRKGTAKLFTTAHPNYAWASAELGVLYHDKGRFSEVEVIYKEAIETTQQTSGETSLSYVLQVNNLAYLYEDMGRFAAAEPLYRESIKLRQQYHADSPIRVASSQSNLARLLAKRHKHEESQQLLTTIMPIFTTHKRSNLYNRITEIANIIGRPPSAESCDEANPKIDQIMPEIENLSETSWRRMQSEMWLGEMALACGDQSLGHQLVRAAQQRSAVIYSEGSEGLNLMQNQAADLLHMQEELSMPD